MFTQPSRVSFLAWIHQSEGVPPSCLGLDDYCSQNQNSGCELRLSLTHPVGRSTRPRTVIHSGETPTPPREEGEEEQEEEERQSPFPLHLPRLRLGPEGGAPLSAAAAAVMSSRGAEPAKEEVEEEPSQTQGLGLNRCVSSRASFSIRKKDRDFSPQSVLNSLKTSYPWCSRNRRHRADPSARVRQPRGPTRLRRNRCQLKQPSRQVCFIEEMKYTCIC